MSRKKKNAIEGASSPEVSSRPIADSETMARLMGIPLPSTETELECSKVWNGRDICICIAGYKEPDYDFMFCFSALFDKRKMRWELRRGDSMIARSRNHLAKRFLATGCTWQLWLDDDLIFPFGPFSTDADAKERRPICAGIFNAMTGMALPEQFSGVNPIERLVAWNKTMIGGCYWDRHGRNSIMAGFQTQWLHKPPHDSLHPVIFCGTGFLLVHRKVYEDVAVKFPDVLHDGQLGNECGFFTPIQGKNRMMGEDEAFAWRATQAGHPSYLDLGIVCGHVGRKVHGIPENWR